MPPVSRPFKRSVFVILMNYNDHAPPHVHVKYRGDMRSYRVEIKTRTWMKPGKNLPPKVKKMVEKWVEVYAKALLEQCDKAMNGQSIAIVDEL
jgi:hypothetical protein